jgi:hypothetical protein
MWRARSWVTFIKALMMQWLDTHFLPSWLEKDQKLTQGEIESILKSTALTMPRTGSRNILANTAPTTIPWDTNCNGSTCDPVGVGLLQVAAAVTASEASIFIFYEAYPASILVKCLNHEIIKPVTS